MPYTFKLDPILPIIIVAYSNPIDFMNDPLKIVEQINSYGKDFEDTIFIIHDIRNLKISFGDLAFALVSAFKLSQYESNIEDRLCTIAVGAGRMGRVAGQLTKQNQYGNREILFYDSLEDAITAIEHLISSAKENSHTNKE